MKFAGLLFINKTSALVKVQKPVEIRLKFYVVKITQWWTVILLNCSAQKRSESKKLTFLFFKLTADKIHKISESNDTERGWHSSQLNKIKNNVSHIYGSIPVTTTDST